MAFEESKIASSQVEVMRDSLTKTRNSTNGTIGAHTRKLADLESAISQVVQIMNTKALQPEPSGDGAMVETRDFPR
jgi:hypothetical protein